MHRNSNYIALFVLLFVSARSSLAVDVRAELLEGVPTITAPGVPGPLCAFGPDTHVIVTGQTSKNIYEPVVVAATFGSGRVVVFGHGGYFDGASLLHDGTSRLLQNAALWATHRTSGDTSKPARVVTVENEPFAQMLTDAGFDARSIALKQLSVATSEADVVIVNSHRLRSDADRHALIRFVQRGGGLLTAGLGWGWQQLNPTQSLVENNPGNKLLVQMGIVFADGYLSTTAADGYDTSLGDSEHTHAGSALDALVVAKQAGTEADAGHLAQAAATLTRAIQAIPLADRMFVPRLEKIDRQFGDAIVPSETAPLRAEDALQRVLLARQIRMLDAEHRSIQAHPAAATFPDAIAGDTRLINQTVAIDCTVPDWHSTGLYAPPGSVIQVIVSDDAANAGLRVRIGAHKDELWHKAQWNRVPEITVEQPLNQQRVEIGTAFGGLVYLVVPRNCLHAQIDVHIQGAVEAPLFVLDETNLDEWRNTIRHAPAPWGELATDKIILTLPTRVLATLENPDILMRWWDTVLDAQADLRTISRTRVRPERVVCDVQISAGYMHAGYPIMTHLDVVETFVDLHKLRSGNTWGIFHELGHNHQHGDWTFSGTGEVTCNIFTLYALQQCCDDGAKGHDAVQPDAIARRTQQHRTRGGTFDSWKNDPFLALIMYIQLQNEFGWDAYKKVFAEYESLPPEQRPATELDKRDQWMVRFSRAVGRNLGPFFQWWGVPTSESARQSIKNLHVWMPHDLAQFDTVTK